MSDVETTERKTIGMASIGRNARASNFVLDDEQRMDLDDISQNLQKLLDKILPEWVTINIEVVKYE